MATRAAKALGAKRIVLAAGEVDPKGLRPQTPLQSIPEIDGTSHARSQPKRTEPSDEIRISERPLALRSP